ncbi:MAG: class I SAM-dependent methyltransferase [Thermoplasmata archaeon]
MLERFQLLQHAALREGDSVLEVGSGGHAISTVPLAFLVGAEGWVLAVERKRWDHFRTIVAASGMADRIRAAAGDALRLPVRPDAVSLAVCIHGIRSLGDDRNVVGVLREMLRVAPRIAIAETLPIARTEAQRAHLVLYNLREEVLLDSTGHPDDLPYRPLARLVSLVREAGGAVGETHILDVDLPHALAYFPRALIESIPNGGRRERLLARWDEANERRLQSGEDHPPVGMIVATRRTLPPALRDRQATTSHPSASNRRNVGNGRGGI